MTVITISREFGSFGSEISQNVASMLRYKLIDKALIEEILQGYGLVEFNQAYDNISNHWTQLNPENRILLDMLNKVILAFAKHNNVLILGRGGFVVLKQYSNVLNIRIKAPYISRVKNIMKKENISDRNKAEQIIKNQDQIRESFLQYFYEKKWGDTDFFDLVINTETIPVNMASKWIYDAARELETKKLEADQITQSIYVDDVLARVVNEKF